MTKTIDLKEMKRKTYIAYHQDGLIDIIIALCLGGIAITAALGSETNLLGYMPIFFFPSLKNRITIPRLGYVKFPQAMEENKKLRMTLLVIAAILSFLFGMGMGYLISHNDTMGNFYDQFESLIGVVLWGIILFALGFVTKVNRLLVYAIAAMATAAIGYFLNLSQVIIPALLAGGILAAGCVLLSRFIKKFPLQREIGVE